MPKRIDQVRIGDKVLTATPRGGFALEPVIFWLHRDVTRRQVQYLRLVAKDPVSNATVALSISRSHFMHAAEPSKRIPALSGAEMRAATDLKVGQWVWALGNNDSSLKPFVVSSISLANIDGAYSVLTPSGTAIVDGVLTSNFADIVNEDGSFLCELFVEKHHIPAFLQMTMAPVRWGYRLLGSKVMNKICTPASHEAPTVQLASLIPIGEALQWAATMFRRTRTE